MYIYNYLFTFMCFYTAHKSFKLQFIGQHKKRLTVFDLKFDPFH